MFKFQVRLQRFNLFLWWLWPQRGSKYITVQVGPILLGWRIAKVDKISPYWEFRPSKDAIFKLGKLHVYSYTTSFKWWARRRPAELAIACAVLALPLAGLLALAVWLAGGVG